LGENVRLDECEGDRVAVTEWQFEELELCETAGDPEADVDGVPLCELVGEIERDAHAVPLNEPVTLGSAVFD